MKSSHIFLVVVVGAVVAIAFYAFKGTESDAEYTKKILNERTERERYMTSSAASPFANSATEFKGLSYYPPNEKYRVMATLTPVDVKKVRTLDTNDGDEIKFQEYAYATFELDGHKNRLLILEVMEMGPSHGTLFLAFGDKTSAEETYGAGRYLDVKKAPGSHTIELDFNLAYNPYCAYIDHYSCPFPPSENLLPIPIKAGEKKYH